MHDLALDALHAAMRGLSARQRVISDNVANVETPTFLAGRVDFEDSLRDAVRKGDPLGATDFSSRRSLAPTLPNGNNVRLDEEMIDSAETELRYSLAVNAMSGKFRLLRTSIGA